MSQPSEQSAAAPAAAPAGQGSAVGQAPPAPASALAPAEPGESGLSRVLHSRLSLLVLIVVLVGAYATYRIVGSHSAAAAHTVAASELEVGDCFAAPAGSSGVTGVKVQLIACDQPHNSEVFVEPAITDSSFSQAAVLHSEADDACNDADSQSDLSEILPVGYTTVDFYPEDAAAFAGLKNFICVVQFSSPTDESWLESDSAS